MGTPERRATIDSVLEEYRRGPCPWHRAGTDIPMNKLNPVPERIERSLCCHPQARYFFAQLPHLGDTGSEGPPGVGRDQCGSLLRNRGAGWSCGKPGAQFRRGCDDGASMRTRRPPHRQTGLLLVALRRANAGSQVICNLFPAAENVGLRHPFVLHQLFTLTGSDSLTVPIIRIHPANGHTRFTLTRGRVYALISG